MENNINKDNKENINPRKKYTPKKKKKEISDIELNEKLTLLLKEEAERILPSDNNIEFKTISEEEEMERLRKKYIPSPDNDVPVYPVEDLIDKLISDMNSLYPEKSDTEEKTEEIAEEESFSQEDIEVIAKKINDQISKINAKFYSLIKEEDEEQIIEEVKIKVSKPKSIKIPKETYKQIKAHCKEHNVDIEDWIEKITLNEINRIVIRLGDLDYKKLKKKKKKKENSI